MPIRNIFLIFCVSFLLSSCNSGLNSNEKTDVIFSSDLFHPHGDLDDQVDLAVLYGLPNIDLKLVILDNGKAQLKRPGSIPVSQLNKLTGRTIPAKIGLATNLQNQTDKALDQPEEFQSAVNGLLDVIEKASKKVVIITVGSLRDLAAAYNRSPRLFHEKVEKILVFAGDASEGGFIETNVKMDRQAYAAIMNSDLPIFWIPCFDGGLWENRGRASYWQTTYGKILEDISDPLLQYFLYAAKRLPYDPFIALEEKIDQDFKNDFFKSARNLWSCSLFYLATGKTVLKKGQGYDIVPIEKADMDMVIYDFVPVNIEVSSAGELHYLNNGTGHKVLQFRIRKAQDYNRIMTDVTHDLLIALSATISKFQKTN